jgi:hypothetical protein
VNVDDHEKSKGKPAKMAGKAAKAANFCVITRRGGKADPDRVLLGH